MFEEQHHICTVCGHRHQLTAHHKIRRRDGGSNEKWNLVGVCRPCHDEIHQTGKGCQEDGGYRDMTASAAASAAHWDLVRDRWVHFGMLEIYEIREAGRRRDAYLRSGNDGPSSFASALYDALQQIEPRCT